jgi:hypothetical protein
MLSPTKKRVPCPSRVLCARAGLLADIAAADHRIHAKLLTTRFNLDRTFFASCRAGAPGRSAEVLRWQAFALRRPALRQDDRGGESA